MGKAKKTTQRKTGGRTFSSSSSRGIQAIDCASEGHDDSKLAVRMISLTATHGEYLSRWNEDDEDVEFSDDR